MLVLSPLLSPRWCTPCADTSRLRLEIAFEAFAGEQSPLLGARERKLKEQRISFYSRGFFEISESGGIVTEGACRSDFCGQRSWYFVLMGWH